MKIFTVVVFVVFNQNRRMTRIFIRNIQSGLFVDGSDNSGPVVNRINNNPNELNEVSEFISYRKVSALLTIIQRE